MSRHLSDNYFMRLEPANKITNLNCVHKPSNIFFNVYNIRSLRRFCLRDCQGKLRYPIIDHIKPFYQTSKKSQKDSLKLSQSFIVSQPYREGLSVEALCHISDMCHLNKLQMCYKETRFRNTEAWLIVVAHYGVNLLSALHFAETLPKH